MKKIIRINSLLTVALLTTIFGDFFALFAYMGFINNILNSILLTALIIPIKDIGAAIASYAFAYISRRLSVKVILICSLMLSSLTIGLFLRFNDYISTHIYLVYVFYLIQGVLTQLFLNGRDVYSKETEKYESDVTFTIIHKMQSLIETGAGFGMFLGSIAFVLLYTYSNFDFKKVIMIDMITFLFAALICILLPSINAFETSVNFKKTLVFIKSKIIRKEIFKVRTVHMWLTFGLINLLLFKVANQNYKIDFIYTACLYSAVGFGVGTMSFILKKYSEVLTKKVVIFFDINDEKAHIIFSIVGFGIIGISYFFFAFIGSSPWVGVLCCFSIGCGNAIQKVSTRAIMRLDASPSDFSDMLSLEYFIAKIIFIPFAILIPLCETYSSIFTSMNYLVLILIILTVYSLNKMINKKIQCCHAT